MSDISLNFENSIFSQYNNHGLSDDAEKVKNQITEAKSEIKGGSISMGKSYSDLQNELQTIFDESKVDNWDGYGAHPVNIESYLEAQKFIDCLPVTTTILPEASIDPDGEVSLEWYKDPKFSFSISFSGNDMVAYAGLFGLNKINGTEYFGDEIPEIILDNIKRVYS